MKYVLDLDKNTVHRETCERVGKNTVVWNDLLIRLVENGKKKVCSVCSRNDYRRLWRTKNGEILAKTGHKFIAVAGGTAFHRNTCGLALSSRRLIGFATYKGAAKGGRCPCKICKPTNSDEVWADMPKPKKKRKNKSPKEFQGLKKEEVRAIKRYREARSEFEQNNNDKTEDLYTLTQTGFAFWAARGYKNFHLRNCPKLNGLNDLKGFGKYDRALKAGYTPCKQCKPTKKHNVEFSIPLNSRKVKDETVEKLEVMCVQNGYSYRVDESFFYLETPKGKWKIHIHAKPIRLEHINLLYSSRTYHRQPKLFFSLTDTFNYIKKHDKQ